MVAHTPTMYLMVVAVSLALAVSVATLADLRTARREGMPLWAMGLALFALTYALFSLRGNISDWLSLVLANASLSAAIACFTQAMLTFQQRRVPALWLWSPAGVAALMLAASSSLVLNLGVMAAVLGAQTVALIVVVLQRHTTTVGRGKNLIVLALLIVIAIFVSRLVGVLAGIDQSVSVNQSSLIQSATHMLGMVSVIMLTVGFVIMNKERADSLNLELAMRDELTRLHNRRAILEGLQQQIAVARRTGAPLSVLMLDVDHFKRLNDALGHVAGDQVLRGIADAIRPRMRANDLPGRLGGEEFLVVLPQSTRAAAAQIAERLRAAVHEASFKVDGAQPVTVSVSIGVAQFDDQRHTDCDSLIQQADQALYRAKSGGRNRVELDFSSPAPACP